MIYEDCRYDATKSRELVNMKIHVSLDEICLSYNFIQFLSQQHIHDFKNSRAEVDSLVYDVKHMFFCT